jgi:predicted DNA-binding antitoxin AbrB/MazE fold protein
VSGAIARNYNGRRIRRSHVAGPRTVDAVYEDGVLKPLGALDLPEHQRVRVTVDVAADERPDEALRAWQAVYDGLAEEDVDEVEAIAFDRRHFMRPPP